MNMASALGLTSPTIEGRIILTAENKTAEGFDAARKQLDEFQKEAAKIQIELNTHKRTVLRQQREHIKEVEKVGKITGEMFSKISAAAVGAFAVVSETLEHFGDIYRELEQRAASREILLRANTNITPASIHESALRIANAKHLKSVTAADDMLAALVSRGVDKYEGTRRYNTLLNAAGFSGMSPESIQGQISEAIRIGRPGMFAKILGGIDPNYFGRVGTPRRERLTERFEALKDKPQEAEALFFEMLKDEEKKVKGFSTAWETFNKANEAYNDKMRAMEKITEEQAALVGPLYDRFNKAITDVITEFDKWPEPIRDAALAITALGSTVMDLVKEFSGVAVGLGVWWALMRRGAPVGAAAAAAGTAATGTAVGAAGRGLLRGPLGATLGVLGRVAGPAASAYSLYEGLSTMNQMKGGDGSLRSIVKWLTGKDPDKIGAAPGVTGAYSQPMWWNGRNLMDPSLQMNRTKDDWLGRSYVPRSFHYDPRQYRGTVLPPGVGSGINPISYHPGGEVDGSDRQRGSTAADATRSVRSFTEAVKYATWTLQRFSNESGLGGGGPDGLGGGLGGGDRLGGGFGGHVPGGLGLGGGGDASMGPVSGSTRSRGNLAKNQQAAYAAFRELGYDDKSARIAVGNLSGESLRDPTDTHPDPSRRNPGQRAHGIASWDQSRSNAIAKEFGASPEKLSLADQVKAFDWEMRTKYPKAYADMKNSALLDEQRMYSVVKNFEAPANPRGDAATRLRLMRGMDVKEAAGAGGAVVVQNGTPASVRAPLPPHMARRPRARPPLAQDRDPLNNLQTSQSLHLGRGAVDVNLKLDRQLAAAGPASIYHASNFDLGVNVDRTGHPFSRPGDPAFPPPPSYA